ncbi:hypothetical protein ACFL2Q_17250 [Thermodesulfobacteriota bacterium]
MPSNAFDLMKVWTQSNADSERMMKGMLLDALDRVVKAESDVLSRIKQADPVSTPMTKS